MQRNALLLISLLFCLLSMQAQQNKITSILEILDIETGERTTVKEFPYLIEAPNWTYDEQWLIYNSGGKLWKLSPITPAEPEEIYTGFATNCNNDHCLLYTSRCV